MTTFTLMRLLGDIMEFIRKNWFAVIVIVTLCVILGQIGDGSPPNLQDNIVVQAGHF
jgi:hypothetical protein